ncbi:MAG: PAS domain S-box protein [Burkholderiales bacterium]|nr:PAS domain S-box protein [Burkholderiales bacterium]
MPQHSALPDKHAGAARPRPKFARRLRHLVLGLGALAAMAVIAGTALSVWRMYQDVIQQAEGHMLDLAHILGEQTLRSTHAVDAVLAAAAEDAHRAASRGRLIPSKRLHQHLRETIAATPYVRALLLTDASGKLIIHTAQFPPPPLKYDDRDYFRAHRAGRGQNLLLSAPVRGKFGGKLSIPISRRVDDENGQFLGVVTADVDPSFFLWPQGLHELGPDGAVRLLRRDGVLLTGYPQAIVAATSDYRDSALFIQGVEAGRPLIHHVGAVNAVERVSAIYPVAGYPLVITVSSSMNFILQAWKRNAWLFGTIAALTALLFGVITLSLAHQLRVDEELKASVIDSEERLHTIIQSAMDAIVIVDEQQRVVLFNAAAEQIFRCPSANAIGAEIGRFISGHVLRAQSQFNAEFDDGGAPVRKTGEHLALIGLRADAREFPIEASISQVQLHEMGHFVLILRDVTERKQVEAALRENEQRYRTLFSQAMDGILMVDAGGNIIDVNESFARMHGYSVDALLQMNLRDLDTPETQALAPARIRRILAGEPLGFEVEHYHHDGHILPLDVATSGIDIDGKMFVLAFHRDITERRRAEQEIKRSQQALRGLSKAANEALEAERRRTARELHDELGQSLTALKMDLESLRSALPPGQPELGERALGMHALLDSTIAATRRIAADLRPLMLDDLGLAAALDWLTQNFSKHTGIATDLIIDESVAQVPEPIASALYRITQESLTNVAKYARATATEIRLERKGEWVQLQVRDNGRGIEAADQEKRGTYGLLGIRERVALLGGEVEIDGEPGQGSEVRARIPLVASGTETAA